MSDITEASSGRNSDNFPSNNALPHSSSHGPASANEITSGHQHLPREDKENSHSNDTRLILLTCSVSCLPSNNSDNHLSERTGESPEKTTVVDSTPKISGKKFSQHLTYCGINRGKCNGGCVTLLDENLHSSEPKSIRNSGQNKLTYRGVTRHRWTRKYEAHIWDGSQITEGHKRKGKHVYLGGYESEAEAARAYDLTALKYWGPKAMTKLNFPIIFYEKELEEMESMSREEFVTSLRRKSICFTRGSSAYRGVTRHRDGRWQARIKVASSKKDTYLGTFSTEEEAAQAYDAAAVKFRGMKALTNFDISNYLEEGSKDLEGFSQPKRLRYSDKFVIQTACMPDSDPEPDESSRRTMTPLNLPEHPTVAVMPSVSQSVSQAEESISRPIISSILPEHPTPVALIPN
ncbi:AP2-like ethylene-responsive transcription factor PLT2 [Telopea speciosissima]|uniref:AP2-like ethylene-responsive transcription factor PLT2 n=1 Tax=Telopea speciosissima TaxID=54955 RepID=UPI001CC76E1E|nr:AP2-like ethylene-responsive transcription factor PLT2 [Telopea speciosissima]XP_043723452.1 AP2-like ethylene-responsive transcription factor PLT2 [Telopea speciosissima]